MSVLAFRLPIPPTCELCGGPDLEHVDPGEGLNLVECLRCGVWSVYPRPAARELQSHYDEDYYLPWRNEARRRRHMWRRRMRLLRGARQGRLLDVGCAEGQFVELALGRGFAAEGTELSRHAARQTALRLGVPVHCGELVDARFAACSFSVVTIWHVLEHMAHPGEALREARRILEPDGMLVVAVPNRDNHAFRAAYRLARRRRYRVYHSDDREQHLHHWNPRALGETLWCAGFEVLELRPDPCALGWVKAGVDWIGRMHTRFAGEPRTNAMVAIARPREENVG